MDDRKIIYAVFKQSDGFLGRQGYEPLEANDAATLLAVTTEFVAEVGHDMVGLTVEEVENEVKRIVDIGLKSFKEKQN